jgi:protein-L-isoaspartate(D-aspartate) O-methyltransferase
MRCFAWKRLLVSFWVLGLLCSTSCSPPLADQTTTPETVTIIPQASSVVTETTRDSFATVRNRMVAQTIEARGITNPDVLRAMRSVPRHLFVPPALIVDAYADHPLPIGYGQTISQPYIVAWMTELLNLKRGEKVLEIGTGSGYQAAVLAELGLVEVYSIEIIPELAQKADQNLQATGYKNIHLKQGDGYFGWKENEPYDAIIVTAAPDHLPQPLIQQLKNGGRLVIPIGPIGGYQALWRFTRDGEDLHAVNLGGVIFVPLTGGETAPTESITPTQ